MSVNLTYLLLVLLVTEVHAADKNLGESCGVADTCAGASPQIACDVVQKKCLIRHGERCDGSGHSSLCLAGAECKTGTCTCRSDSAAGYSEQSATGKCRVNAGFWGGACGAGFSCDSPTLECRLPNSDVCVCQGTQVVDLSTGHCKVKGEGSSAVVSKTLFILSAILCLFNTKA
ncbi:uncharacterized protein [Littorina saxatilis]|uniref:uncharacterized protein n=1 Tax=Littorina saxatilis TaxID=31220 RepID=UPI0038B65E62